MLCAVGTFWFGVPFRGHVLVLAIGSAAFLLASLGLGLFISTLAQTQQQSMITAFLFIIPMVTISGFGTPVSSMPEFFQRLSYLNPLRHVIFVLRSVYLKGVGLEVLWPSIAFMTVFATILLAISILRFHKSLD